MAVFGIRRIADGKRAHRVAYAPLDVVEPTLGHEEARPRRAGLSAVQEGHEERRRNRLVEIGIIEQDRGRFATQFERDALHGRGAVAHDPLADGHRAREGDLVDIRIPYELRADHVSSADHDVAHAFGELGRVDALDHHLRLQRAQLTRLEDDRTTGAHGGCQLEADEQRVGVPRGNQAGHADRLQGDRRLAPGLCPAATPERPFRPPERP